MATNDFLPFAGGAGANALDQADYEALTALSAGFASGIAPSAACNKVWRQATIMAAVLAQLIVDNTGENAVDDGTTATLVANLKLATSGRLLNIQKFSTAGTFTYTPTAGTKRVVVEVIGPGGGSGGVPATTSAQWVVSGGAGGGAYSKSILTSGFSGVTVTVGAGGTAGTATTAGGNGGTTSFGAILSAAGGYGSSAGTVSSTSPQFGSPGYGADLPTQGNIINVMGGTGSVGHSAVGSGLGGSGGSSGNGFQGPPGKGSGSNALAGNAPGVGAGGTQNQGVQATGNLGAKGADGMCIITEYA